MNSRLTLTTERLKDALSYLNEGLRKGFLEPSTVIAAVEAIKRDMSDYVEINLTKVQREDTRC